MSVGEGGKNRKQGFGVFLLFFEKGGGEEGGLAYTKVQ